MSAASSSKPTIGSATPTCPDSTSSSCRTITRTREWDVLRGLHLQRRNPQGKLVRVVTGHVWDVAVDVNPRSPTFRQWVAVELTEANHLQFYIPPGYAHGFCVLSDRADFEYKCTEFYHPEDEVGLIWNDPELAIDWPLENPIVSARDAANGSLRSLLSAE